MVQIRRERVARRCDKVLCVLFLCFVALYAGSARALPIRIRALDCQRGSKNTRRLRYPFPWLKTCRVPIAGTRNDAVIIDMKKFWDNPRLMPSADQRKLVHRPARDYIDYVWDSINLPLRKARPKQHGVVRAPLAQAAYVPLTDFGALLALSRLPTGGIATFAACNEERIACISCSVAVALEVSLPRHLG
jgi:hypothetical protein